MTDDEDDEDDDDEEEDGADVGVVGTAGRVADDDDIIGCDVAPAAVLLLWLLEDT